MDEKTEGLQDRTPAWEAELMTALETWYIGPGGSFIGLIDVLRRYGVFKEPPISRACDDAYLTCNEASKAAQAIRLDALSPEARAQYDEIIRTAVEEAAELGERLRNKK